MPMDPDDEVCLCFHVTRRKLVNWVRLHRPRVPSQISQCGGAGTGCGWCVPFLKLIARRGQAADAPAMEAVSAEEYARRRADHIRAGKGKPPPAAEPMGGETGAQSIEG